MVRSWFYVFSVEEKKRGCDIDWETYSATSTATSLQFGTLEFAIGWSD
jgi:hypothetical protein